MNSRPRLSKPPIIGKLTSGAPATGTISKPAGTSIFAQDGASAANAEATRVANTVTAKPE